MVKPVQKAEINSFVKGLITEVNPLNFPADASRAEENFILKTDGSRERRLGLDFEEDYTLRDTGMIPSVLASAEVSSFKWLNAGNDANNEFVVVQFGNKIDVYNTTVENISTDGFIGSVTIPVSSNDIRFSYTSVDGMLIIAAGTEEVHVIKYSEGSLAYSAKRLLVRDQWGLHDLEGNYINVRTTTLTNNHLYNLHNQGWGVPRKNSTGTLSDPITLFAHRNDTTTTTYVFVESGVGEGGEITGRWEAIDTVIPNISYPSNAETVYTGLQFQPVTEGASFERIYPNLYDEVLGLNTKAAKGYFIIDALRRGTSRLEAFNNNKDKFKELTGSLAPIPADITPSGASVVTEYAGRIFYAGFGGATVEGDINSPTLSSYVLFSKLIQNEDDLIRCYQDGDPTSREGSDLVDTDGGFIRISGLKQIKGMISQDNCLLIIADNGIWKVVGGSDYGFSATNYSVIKLSEYGCNNSSSIVVVNKQVAFWGEEGIFFITKDQYGDWTVQNVSEGTIQSLFDSIDITDRERAVGVYDPFTKKVRWMYNQDTDSFNNNIVYELILNLAIKAFSLTRVYNLEEDSPEVIGYITASSFIAGDVLEGVVVEDVPVVVASELVVIDSVVRTEGLQSIKYITLHDLVGSNKGYTFSQYRNTNFREWQTADGVGVDAKAYVLTGTITAGDSSIAKQSPYLVMHMLKTESGMIEIDGQLVPDNQSSCLIRSQWDWANSANSGKWSDLFQAYRYRRAYFATGPSDPYDNGFETVVTKNKLRGRGRALSLYFETEPDKDCKILGWNLSLTGNSLA